ncbi:hypothetical protein CWC03_03065 [Pseudoalteromonas sp. S2755]|nr:hypothetical protein CWC03_03065 [Pseudoalteromonas sp. S2755]
MAAICLYAVQAVMHLMRLAEKLFLETNYLSHLYTFVVVSVNIMFVFIAVACIIRTMQKQNLLKESV